MSASNPCSAVLQFNRSLRFCKGAPLAPGIKPHIYAISKSDITTWPTRPSGTPSEDGLDSVTNGYVLSDNFVLAADKAWHRIDLVENVGTLHWETQGGQYSRTFKADFEVRFPDATDPQAAYLQYRAVNDDVVYLVPSRTGKYYLVGNPLYRTETTANATFGEGVDADDNGAAFAVECTDIFPPLHYSGNIVTENEGTISGATGNPVVVTPTQTN